jgi:hypothetical protein
MDDDSKVQGMVKWALGALGLGAVASVVAIPKLGMLALWIGLLVLLLALIIFGGYFWWQHRAAKRRQLQFTSAIEEQTSAAPKAISDPNKRASLDKVRQKFQTGLQEFRSRGKDIYKLPWYVIIGESGSGKTEAIRHSGIDFPPGLQDELQGSGGTVNMDWWFTNRGIILDTAGSMIFSEAKAAEAPEWREFLRLLKKARPHCPINGLFLVLSADSLIKDSAEKIAQKASVLAQQLDLIQRTLDVRFPVYLFVTKCDLLMGFREFFDNIDDPLLQHQMFGWSNPDPLDTAFRPDLVEQYLNTMASKVRRRRLALLREASSTPRYGDTQQFYKSGASSGSRRLDEVDSLFALPESLMRLAPRLRRYLETVFVAGEWSAKPVFLRGIYFTSSMREGKALDEAIAFATGVSLDQLPGDNRWEKNRAFFLRDMFHEKVFRESGLVTRATNTLKLLRQRQLAIFGTAGVAFILLTVLAIFSFKNFQNSVGKEARFWQLGADGFKGGDWAWPIVKAGPPGEVYPFSYEGNTPVDGLDGMTLVGYQARLAEIAPKKLSTGWIFAPLAWMNIGDVKERPHAQQVIFESAVLKPLIDETRNRMVDTNSAGNFAYLQQALHALIQLEADNLSARSKDGALSTVYPYGVAGNYLNSFTSYLMDTNFQSDTNLIGVMAWTYSKSGGGYWPPQELIRGDHLSNNPAIESGLLAFQAEKHATDVRIGNEVQNLNKLVDDLEDYAHKEATMLQKPDCNFLVTDLAPAEKTVVNQQLAFLATNNFTGRQVTNITQRYQDLEQAARNASDAEFSDIGAGLADEFRTQGIIQEIFDQVKRFSSAAAQSVRENYDSRSGEVSDLDANYMVPAGTSPAYDVRFSLFASACALGTASLNLDESIIGDKWTRYNNIKAKSSQFQTTLAGYKDPLPFAGPVATACAHIAANAEDTLKEGFLNAYADVVKKKLAALVGQPNWTGNTVTNTGYWFSLIKADLDASPDDQAELIAPVRKQLGVSIQSVLDEIDQQMRNEFGFPLEFDATKSMSLDEVRAARQLVNGLTTELQNQVWNGDRSQALQQRCASYVSVVNSLLDDQGNPVGWELYFLPEGSDHDAIADLRFVQLVFGGTPGTWIDLTQQKDSQSLGNGTADNAFILAFSQDEQNALQKVSKEDWGLVRLIHDYHAAPVENDRTQWQFQIPLADAAQNVHGIAQFEAKLINPKQPLPKVEDWPKQ